MAAIVRIKRRRDEDPQDLLLLSCKKLKSSDGIEKNENDDQRAVFKFAGTVSSKDAAVSKPVREAIRKEKLEKEFKQHQVNLYGDVRQKTRLESKESSEKSRYRVVSSHRALNLDNLDEVDDHVGEQPNTTQADESMKQLDKPNEGSMPSAENDARTCKLCGRVVYPSKQTTNKCECGSNLELSNEVKDNTTKRSVDDTKEQLCDREKKDCLKECDTKTEKSGKSCNKIDSGINMNGSSTTTTTTSAASVSADNIGSAEADRKMFCLLDVETDFPSYQSVLNSLTTTDQITCNAEPMTHELAPERGSDKDYVYDLYYINNQDFDFRSLERGLTLEAMSEDCLYAGGLSDDDEFIYEDDDDENNENNWRNDYPDEDPGFVDNQDDDEDEFYGEGLHEIHAFDSGQDNQLADWMSWRCNIEDTNELSSDDDIERYEAGPTHSNEYYKYVRQAVNGAESGSEDGTELPCL